MKKELYKGISLFAGIINPHQEDFPEDVPEVLNTDLQSVLNEIFSVDERTGLPNGDIQYYLSKDGNPSVKAWLETNLLMPRSVSTGSSVEGVTDDLIVEMSRKSDESFVDYALRLDSIRNEAVNNSVENSKSD